MADVEHGQDTPTPQRRRGWFGRNWLWFVPTVLLGLALLCGAVFYSKFARMRASEPFQMALERVCSDPEVIEQLGEPVEETGWVFHGELSASDARFDFHVAGPRGRAYVHTEGRRTDDRWDLTRLLVTPDGGRQIKLDLADVSGLEEAPPFRP